MRILKNSIAIQRALRYLYSYRLVLRQSIIRDNTMTIGRYFNIIKRKIVLFPVFYSGGYEILIRVYGEDKDKIFNNLNFPPLYNITESDMIEIDRFEKEIGVIIYEKD